MSAAAAGAAGAAAAANAVRAFGTIVKIPPETFQGLVNRAGDVVVVHATGGMFRRHHRYLTSYKGLAFFTKSEHRLPLPSSAEVVEAQTIRIPE